MSQPNAPFNPFAAWSNLPTAGFNPMDLWQNYWQFWSSMQQNMMQQWMSGFGALSQMGSGVGAQANLPAWPWGTMPDVADFVKAGGLAAFMPKVDAVVTPLETTGALTGANEAARLSMRLAMPGCIGPAEMVLIEAVVARAPADSVPRLGEVTKDLLPKKD